MKRKSFQLQFWRFEVFIALICWWHPYFFMYIRIVTLPAYDEMTSLCPVLKSSSALPDRFWGPPNLLPNRYQGALSLEVKLPGREADHSPPSSAQVKNAWSYTSTPPMRLSGVVLRAQGKFTLPVPYSSYTLGRTQTMNRPTASECWLHSCPAWDSTLRVPGLLLSEWPLRSVSFC
jgi:hypothetical protein